MTNRWIYHLSRSKDWLWAKRTASYNGSKEDIADGFLHFSTAHQVEESALKHRTGEHNIILLEVDAFKLGPALRWETSRNSQKFPHLYESLSPNAVIREFSLPLDRNCRHVFPQMKTEPI